MGKRPELTLLQGEHTEGPETYERILSITRIGQMQIKTTMRHHYTPVRMAIINKSTNNKCWWRCSEKGTIVNLVGMQTGVAAVKTVWNFLQKMKMPFDPLIPLLGLYPKNPKTLSQRNPSTLMFTAAQFTIAKCWKQPKCPSVNEWIKKRWCIAVERKKQLLPFATAWMDLESIMLSAVSYTHLTLPTTRTSCRSRWSPYH